MTANIIFVIYSFITNDKTVFIGHIFIRLKSKNNPVGKEKYSDVLAAESETCYTEINLFQ